MNDRKISPRMMHYMLYWSAIQNGWETNTDGNPPTLAERIMAGSCLSTVFVVLELDQQFDESAMIRAGSLSLGEKWPGPSKVHQEALENLKGVLCNAG